MAVDPEGVVSFAVGDKTYTAFFGFRAIKAVETHYDLPFFKALQHAMPSLSPADVDDPEKVAAAGASLRITEVARLFEFSLLKHHPDLGGDEVENMIDDLGFDRVGEVLGQAVAAAMSKGDDGTSPANPPKQASPAKKTG